MSVLEKKLKVFYLTSPEPRRTAPPVVEEKTGDDRVEKLEEIAKQTDSPEMEQLKQRNELLENNVQNLHSRVDQLTSQLEQSSKTTESLTRAVEALLAQQGQPASPEAIQEGTEAGKQQIQEEAINEMKKPESKEKAKSFWTADLGKVFKNAPLWQKALIVLAGGALTGFALTATLSGVVPGVAFLGSQAGFAGLGAPTFLAAGLKGIAAATTALGFTKTVEGALIAGKEAMKSLNPEPNPNTPPLQPVAEQQVQQPQFQEANEGKMEKAKGIVSSLAEVEGEPISYNGSRDGNPIRVDLKYSNDQYTFQTSDQPGYRSNIISENDLADGLARLDNDTLESLQNQIDDIKVRKEQAQQQPKTEEQLNSPESQEKAPESLDLKTLKTGDEIKISAKNEQGNQKDLILVVNDDKTVNVLTENPDGSTQQVAKNYFVHSITTAENGRITGISDNVISTAENTVVSIGNDYKLNQITKLEVVKPTTPEPETPAESPKSSPESTKSRETISQSAYAEIGKNLDKINDTADELNSDLLKSLHGGLYKESEPFTFTEKDKEPKELNLVEYLSATAKPSLENLLGVEPGFGKTPEFTAQELIEMSLAIENTPEIKDSLKQIKTDIPDKISNYKGDSAAYEVMQVVGENLAIAKEIILTNRKVEKIKAENTDAADGLNAILKASKDNPIIQAQIADDFDKIRTKVSLEEFSKQLDEALNTKPAPVDSIFMGKDTSEQEKKKNQAIALKLGEKYHTSPSK